MHVICFVNLPWSATARLRKVSLQLSYLSVFSLIKRVFRDAHNEKFLNFHRFTPVSFLEIRLTVLSFLFYYIILVYVSQS